MNNFLLRLWKWLPLTKNTQLIIMRFFQNQFLVGVTGVIFNENSDVLLFKHTYRNTAWSLPGGYLKAGEHPIEGLEREIEEESGLIVSIDARMKIRTDRDSARLDICYIGTFIGGEFKRSDEVEDFGFFSPAKLPQILENQSLLIEKAISQRKNLPAVSVSSPAATQDDSLSRVVDLLTQ